MSEVQAMATMRAMVPLDEADLADEALDEVNEDDFAEVITWNERDNAAADLGLLVLRLAVGGLLAGHGAQKLFGAFGGAGLQGTAGWLESMGLKPGDRWALLAGLSEFGGGMLTALGLFHPLGPIATEGAMSLATFRVHAGKPIWNTQGGAELPVTNMSAALALALAGPGRFSLDEALGIRVPREVAALAGLAVVAGFGYAQREMSMFSGDGQSGQSAEAAD
ncbi:MAG TPA: DoxX family protein [Thermomicrobiales bacterium]|nr:DoxX family protein [Thermomicrobiales bacterium]